MRPRIDVILAAAAALVLLVTVPVGVLIYWALTGTGVLLVFVAGRIVGQLSERRRAARDARTIEALRDALAHTDPARFQ